MCLVVSAALDCCGYCECLSAAPVPADIVSRFWLFCLLAGRHLLIPVEVVAGTVADDGAEGRPFGTGELGSGSIVQGGCRRAPASQVLHLVLPATCHRQQVVPVMVDKARMVIGPRCQATAASGRPMHWQARCVSREVILIVSF